MKNTRHTITQIKTHFLFGFLFALLSLIHTESFSQATCTSSGNWSSGSVWSPAMPAAGETVTVAVGCTLHVDMTTAIIGNLTVNGVLIIDASATAVLNVNGNIDVNNGAVLDNNGRINLTTAGKTFNLNGTATYIHNPLNNAVIDETIFSNGIETFSNTSTLDIKKWSNGAIPLGNSRNASSNFKQFDFGS
ncbi:MAG: hypothetical protein IPP51_09125 [Bacteroidetes bacterium]|nr:hypothetical protein [Bacteroidota bacterium]